MPATDAAFPIISTILDIVPASRWTFARVEPHGDLSVAMGSHGPVNRIGKLVDELRRQREITAHGSRIAATLGSLDGFASGIALIFADARADFGILHLLRSADMGPFTSNEVGMLTFALDAASERFSALRLQPLAKHAADGRAPAVDAAASAADGAFYVLDSDFRIVMAWNADDRRIIGVTGDRGHAAERLPSVLESAVRALTVNWAVDSVNAPGISRPVPFLVLRTKPMSGAAGLFIGVRIDRFHEPNSLTTAADRFHISPREVQVLALLLDGNHLDQIAKLMHITSSTVQDHIKSMLDKTESGNRSELIARVLGWESAPTAFSA